MAAFAARACNEAGAELLIDDFKATKIVLIEECASGFREATMTVRAILDSKGHQVQIVEPDIKLSAAVKRFWRSRRSAPCW